MKTDPEDETLNKVLHYHQQTKHNFHRSAEAPDYLDWKINPIPFDVIMAHR